MILLASNSPRRRELISLGGWHFIAQPAHVDETPLPNEQPLDYVTRLAKEKAFTSAAQAQDIGLVVAADTTVADGSHIMGKPVDAAEAWQMLHQLRGRKHQVFTGLAVLNPNDEHLAVDWCLTDVPMRSYTDDEIHVYIESGDPMDKAGAYAIQHPGFKPVIDLSGCYANVMGLPLCHLARTLRLFDMTTPNDIPSACQLHLQYICPVYRHYIHASE